MKRLLLLLVLVASLVAPASALGSNDRLPLHAGSQGDRVAALQWLISGHRPNVFTAVKPTLKVYTKKVYGSNESRTARAVYAYKYRLGYPARYNSKAHPIAGRYLFDLMLGHKQRTKEMVALAQRRLRVVVPGVSPLALKMKQLAITQLGVTESPWGCNCGPRISYPWPAHAAYPSYESSTGQYRVAWCASWIQWLLQRVGYGTIADRSAGVLYIEGWARIRGYLSSKPRVGSLVAYLDDGGHIGFVSHITASGYSEISGNTSNAVRETWHAWSYRLRVFINLPRIA